MRLTLEYEPPTDARWLSIDSDGDVYLWRTKPKPVTHNSDGAEFPDGEGYWLALTSTALEVFTTNIPCPAWRDSLRRL
jgi:hypothetical protein